MSGYIKGDIVVFESEISGTKIMGREIPQNEYEWMDYYPIEFADGSGLGETYGESNYQFYHYAMIVEVLFFISSVFTVVLIGIRKDGLHFTA